MKYIVLCGIHSITALIIHDHLGTTCLHDIIQHGRCLGDQHHWFEDFQYTKTVKEARKLLIIRSVFSLMVGLGVKFELCLTIFNESYRADIYIYTYSY